MYCLKCKRDKHNLETCFYKNGFPLGHKMHGVDFNNKPDKHLKRDYYSKRGRNYKGKHQSYNTISKGDNEDSSSNKDNSKDTPDGVFITRDNQPSYFLRQDSAKMNNLKPTWQNEHLLAILSPSPHIFYLSLGHRHPTSGSQIQGLYIICVCP